MSERERLPKPEEKSILIKLEEEINGMIEETLEDESELKDINNLIYTVVTIMTQIMNQPSKRNTDRRNENLWEIRMEGYISKWRKEI